MISLYLARHGQTEENMARIFQGHLPGRLTVEGISQAEVLRDSLKRIPLDAVVSSDLKRCMDTAEIVMEGRELPWETTSLLREIDWELDGASHQGGRSSSHSGRCGNGGDALSACRLFP